MSATPAVSISEIRQAVENVTGLPAAHLGSYPVHEHLGAGNTWSGLVEVFKVTGHTQASRAYAWAWLDHDEMRYHVVLNVSPIDSPAQAVREAYARGDAR